MAQMVENFKKSLAFVLKHEGGYINDPSDSGGETKWGISKRSYPQLDIKNLTPEQALDIYDRDFWTKAGCDSLNYPLCTVVFDTAVSCGLGKAMSWLKTSQDITNYLFMRKMYYVGIVKNNPSQQKFLTGWLNRLTDLKKLVDISQIQQPDVDVTQLPDWHY